MASRLSGILVIFLVLGSALSDDSNNRCGPGIKTAGWTVPRGDIVIEVGSPLDIYCILDPNSPQAKGYTADDLIFTNGNQRFASEYVKVVNKTTAKLHIEGLPVSSEMIYCKLVSHHGAVVNIPGSSLEEPPHESFDQLVCLNSVVIGSKPKEVSDFECISNNWMILNCTWVEPDNGVKTNYSLSYTTPRRGGRTTWLGCPHYEEGRCVWTMNSTPPYRRMFEYLHFQLEGVNKFGNISMSFKFHNFAHVIPAAPAKLTPLNKTSSSVYLQWDIGVLSFFEKGLTYKVKYTWDSAASWQVEEYTHKEVEKLGEYVRVNVTGLKYPNTAYDFRVYMKSSVASEEKSWSPPASLVVITKPCVPNESPKTDIGSFEVVDDASYDRNVLLHWRKIPKEEYNGNDFRYEITVFEDNKEVNIKPISVTNSFAKFANLSRNHHRFVIRSINAEGPAENASEIILPRKKDILPQPVVFTKADFGDGVYELSWKLRNIADGLLSDLTIFWCDTRRDYPSPCDGLLNWTHVPANTTKFSFTGDPKLPYQFAISVNSQNSSSGMVWAMCTVWHDRINKMNHVRVVNLGSTYINLGWQLECSDRIEGIKGYNITYCPVNEKSREKCESPEKTFLVYGDVTTENANLTDLKPFKSYKMSIAMFTDKRVGPFSDYMYNRTKDGAPEMDNVTIEVVNITSTTAFIKWDPPTVTNGVLDHYEVFYDDNKIIVNETWAQLKRLLSYHQYYVQVAACTKYCSRANPIAIHTKIGSPSEVEHLSATKVNSLQVRLNWTAPSMPAGPNPIYDVKIQYEEASNSSVELTEVNDSSTIVKIPCKPDEPPSTYTFYVRAKNLDNSSESEIFHYGPWSPAYTVDCLNDGLSFKFKLFIALAVAIVFLSCTLFLARKGFYKCRQMKKVEVVLPTNFTMPQLFSNEMKGDAYHIDITPWTDINEIDHLNKLSDIDQGSIDCIDIDLDTDRGTSRSSSGCYTS